MKNIVCIDGEYFYIEPDSSLIRNEESYCIIKDRINKRDTTNVGGIDWQRIRADAESLAKEKGLDLIIASYYTVAVFKTQSFKGFANGLSLINAVLLSQATDDLKQQKLNMGLVEWVQKQITKDIKKLQPTYDTLRDLYRCERECYLLSDFIGRQQATHENGLENATVEIIEHIDRLEMRYQTMGKERSDAERFSWSNTGLVLAASLISAASTFFLMTYLSY
jgi:type VI secretion system protein VasL|tara:strand:+ start:23657 stop:24322 length:666 start_codon:yes stop_codon:yes gene_type:complete